MKVQNPDGHVLFMRDIYKVYGNKTVLENIDFTVSPGEFCSLVGPSGSGKSTLFRMITGEEKPTSGVVLINNEHGGYPDTRRGIVYQKYPLFSNLTVLDNVLFGRRMTSSTIEWYIKKKEFRDEAEYFLKRVRMEEHLKKKPYQLSGGQQQRVAIVRSLIVHPKILMMDEPFSGLDAGVRENIQLFLLELWHEFNMTIIFVTHTIEEAVYLGTRLIVLSQYYTDDRGEKIPRGARIVGDYSIRKTGTINPTTFKQSTEFTDLIAEVTQEISDPTHLQHVRDFHLKHQDSFQTLTLDEDHSIEEG